METVQPIRDLDKLQRMYEIAIAHDKKKGRCEVSWELLLLVGFNTSFRISDLTRIKVKDLRGQDYARMRAKKTGKEANVYINANARKEINRLLDRRNGEEYIFQSRVKYPDTRKPRPITRQRAYQIINGIARAAGVEERIGCHTLRKTFGYHYYQLTHDVVSLQRILGHSFQRETLIYIGVVQENIDESLRQFGTLVPRRGTAK